MAIRTFIFYLGSLILGALMLYACAPQKFPTDKSSALWYIVNDSCVKNQQMDGTPAPCEYVDLNAGYVVYKDIRGKTQYLVMPTKRISGIESPFVLAPGAVNYWQYAWDARKYVFKRAGKELPRRDIGLAINSPYGRSQNQLHIHIDCVRPEVIRTIVAHEDEFSSKWSTLDFGHGIESYRVRRLDSPDLAGANPFVLLADEIGDISHSTLAVIGLDDGFLLLADTADPAHGDRAHSEELLDHNCKVAN